MQNTLMLDHFICEFDIFFRRVLTLKLEGGGVVETPLPSVFLV